MDYQNIFGQFSKSIVHTFVIEVVFDNFSKAIERQ
jgi:hypothetical protein